MYNISSSTSRPWQPARQLAHQVCDRQLREWLLDPASLTHRLRQLCGDRFRVQVLSQGWAIPGTDEWRTLRLRARQLCLVREVRLYCDNKPVVFARTLIPASTLRGRLRQLAGLGNRPLGAFLFSEPNLHRACFELRQFIAGEPGYRIITRGLAQSPDTLWGRRSVFVIDHKPLLVNEIFLQVPGMVRLRQPFSAPGIPLS